MGVVHDLFEVLWRDYLAVTPQAEQVAQLLRGRGDVIVNDHIALRTFAHSRVDIEVLAASLHREQEAKRKKTEAK